MLFYLLQDNHSAKRILFLDLDDVIVAGKMEKIWKMEAVGKNDVPHTSPR